MRKYLCLLVALVILVEAQAQRDGWIQLFDGKSLKGWKKKAGFAEYRVENGNIVGVTVASSPNTFLTTEKIYGDFILEMEVRMEDSTSNSGIQFRSQFDSAANGGRGRVYGYQYELDPSSRGWTGGIYDEARRGWLYPMDLNEGARQSFNVGQYHKVRIECVGNSIQTFLNGKPMALLVDSVNRQGLIALQVHSIRTSEQAGKKIFWRNIRIRTENVSPSPSPGDAYVVNLIPNTLSPWEKKNGWQLLFDGRTADGWKGAYKKSFPDKGWKIEDGVLKVLSSGGREAAHGGDIVTKEKFSAFDLSFDFNLTAGANSGVKYFVTLSENNPGSAIGLEYQILDDKLHPDAKMGRDGNRTLASLYDLIPANKNERFVNQPGQWNRGRIVVHPDNRVEHFLNGVKVVEYKRGSPEFRSLVAISKYKVWQNFGEAPEGYILLQDHGDTVMFRSIKIKKLTNNKDLAR